MTSHMRLGAVQSCNRHLYLTMRHRGREKTKKIPGCDIYTPWITVATTVREMIDRFHQELDEADGIEHRPYRSLAEQRRRYYSEDIVKMADMIEHDTSFFWMVAGVVLPQLEQRLAKVKMREGEL